MANALISILACCILLPVGLQAQQIPPRPVPPALVNDYANLLTPEQKYYLEQRLVAYDDSTSVQIAVVIMPKLDGSNAADFAIELGRKWGVGNKKTNNGVVVLMSMEEGKREVFIAPGYGLEGALPDITCKQIIDAEMIPAFKQGSYYGGLVKGAESIIEATRGEYKAPPGYRNRGSGDEGGAGFFILLLVLVILFVFISSRGGGGNGGDAMTRRGHRHINRPPPFIFFPPIGGGGGGGFGGGGGGFGGFGGGGFGGGGAGGSW